MQDLWYAQDAESVLSQMRSSIPGLREDEAHVRRIHFGQNKFPRQKTRSDIDLFVDQLKNPLLALLAVAWGISLSLHHVTDAFFIGIFILVNTGVGFYQERKAMRALEALHALITVSARVRRDGNEKIVEAEALVPGDIIILSAGDKVPADARIISCRDLRVDESALTGEWLAVFKSTETAPKDAPLAERVSLLYTGTIVEEGTAEAVVVETGRTTELAQIAESAYSMSVRETPLQERIAHLARFAAVIVVVLIIIIVILGILRGQSLGETFVVALALAVSAIPANLLPAVTLILSIGMMRSLKRRVLVRRLASSETLGSVTVICTDKTGTLTEGKMEVSHILAGREVLGEVFHGEDKTAEMLRAHALERGVLGTDAFIENPEDDIYEWNIRGRPTEGAIVLEAHRQGLEKRSLESNFPVIDRLVFSSAEKFSASLRKNGNGAFLSVVGAPEVVLARCTSIHAKPRKVALSVGMRNKIAACVEQLAGSGLRLVAVASSEYKKKPYDIASLGEMNGLALLGFVALKDPLRADARESVLTAERAGVRTLLITGDHPATALSIAREVGIPDKPEMLLLGTDLDALSDEDLDERVRTVTIFARVSPEHKLRIVRALQKRQEVVAMVGDGVNDAPALHAADIGIAVGSGTDVAKEVADIVLLDDSFRSVLSAIEEGRLMFRNIRKVFAYLIGDDFSELSLFVGALLVGLPLPLLPAQILWINIVEDALPVVGLAVDEDRAGIMQEAPRRRSEPLASEPLRKWLLAIFCITGVATFGAFFVFLHAVGSLEEARSMLFALLSIDSLILSLSVRSFVKPLWRSDIFSNSTLSGAILVGVVLTALALYVPPLQQMLGTVSLPIPDLILVGFISAVEIMLIEGYKRVFFGGGKNV